MYNTFIDTLGVDIVHIKDNIYICVCVWGGGGGGGYNTNILILFT